MQRKKERKKRDFRLRCALSLCRRIWCCSCARNDDAEIEKYNVSMRVYQPEPRIESTNTCLAVITGNQPPAVVISCISRCVPDKPVLSLFLSHLYSQNAAGETCLLEPTLAVEDPEAIQIKDWKNITSKIFRALSKHPHPTIFKHIHRHIHKSSQLI